MKGLIIKPKWANLILSNKKNWEIRGSNTKIRGRIGIIISGTKHVYGTVELVDSIKLTKDQFDQYKDNHKLDISYEELLKIYKTPYAWVMQNIVVFDKPVKYNHKLGCVVWVNLNKEQLA